MRVNVYECSAGTDDREFVGTYDLDELFALYEDGMAGSEPEIEAFRVEAAQIREDLEASGKAVMAGGTGVYHEYVLDGPAAALAV
jgi:hypothetical protein